MAEDEGTTMAEFFGRAAESVGGLDELRQRIGVSYATAEVWSTSDVLVPPTQAELLARALDPTHHEEWTS